MSKFSEYKKEISLILVILFCLVFLIFQNLNTLTGNVTEGSTTSNVSVSKYLAVNFGANLSEGIQFGKVVFLPATNVNASHNYDGVNNETTFYISVSNDSNSAVDFCVKANGGLETSGADVIGLGNETYSTSTTTNLSLPSLNSETPFTTNYAKASSGVGVGHSSYWRFWLDVPVSQPSGEYNNTVSFKGVSLGAVC